MSPLAEEVLRLHHSFVPVDDTADTMLPAEDWNRLVALAKAEPRRVDVLFASPPCVMHSKSKKKGSAP